MQVFMHKYKIICLLLTASTRFLNYLYLFKLYELTKWTNR